MRRLFSSSEARFHRWSLRELAEMGPGLLADDANQLLVNVALRLQHQESVCQKLMDCLEHLKRRNWITKNSESNDASSPDSPRRVIRAVNQPMGLDWKVRLQQEPQVQARARQSIQNLLVLHADTHQLTSQLVQHPAILDRFSLADQHLLSAAMEQVRSRHASTVETLAEVVLSLRSVYQETDSNLLDSMVDVFLRGRLGVQLLCDHFVALHKGKRHGGVAVDCSIQSVVDDAVTEAKHVCDAHLQKHPEVFLSIPPDAALTLIRPWVHHALVELLKNAMAANVQVTSEECHPPPIHIDLTEEQDFVCIRVKDQGVGLAGEDALDRAFGFARSSADQRWERLEEQQSYAMVRSPLQSLGVGLPLSRIMMQHFRGDVKLLNNTSRPRVLDMPNGCLATISLHRDDSLLERLPMQEVVEDTNTKDGS